jgi:hypothetical protein
VALQPLSAEKEGWRGVNSGLSATSDVLQDGLAEAVLAEGRLNFCRVQRQPLGHGKQLLRGEVIAAGQEQGIRLPELATRCRKLRELRGELGAGVKLRVRKVAPDQAQGLVALKERLQRSARGKAKRAAKVPILDQRKFGLLGAADVIAASDRDQRGRRDESLMSPAGALRVSG